MKNSIENLFRPLELIFNKIYYSLRIYKLMHEKSYINYLKLGEEIR